MCSYFGKQSTNLANFKSLYIMYIFSKVLFENFPVEMLLKNVIFKIFLGGLLPDPLVIACWLCQFLTTKKPRYYFKYSTNHQLLDRMNFYSL